MDKMSIFCYCLIVNARIAAALRAVFICFFMRRARFAAIKMAGPGPKFGPVYPWIK